MASRGVGQGNLLSPFLLTIVAEALGALLSKTKNIGLISGFEVGGEVEAVTHLQFENDTILFTSTRWEEITNLERILRCCQIALGLKINLSKSFLVDVASSEEIMQTLATRLHCKRGRFPFHYLGMPLGANPRSLSMWDPVIEKL